MLILSLVILLASTDELQFYISLLLKVHIFREGHKILRYLHLTFTVCTVVKSKVNISQNFVAFSENMNFTILSNNLNGNSTWEYCSVE